LETADHQEGELAEAKAERLQEKIARLRAQMAELKALAPIVEAAPDRQLSLTDPDARAMATTRRGSAMVGYNVQAAVETAHHLIVAHEVVNVGHDRSQLAAMAGEAKAAMGAERLEALADRGYFDGEQILACDALGAIPYVPKPPTSLARTEGRFDRQDFVYLPGEEVYRCPAGERLTWRYATVENGLTLNRYWSSTCGGCPLSSGARRVPRGESPLGARGGAQVDAGAAGPQAGGHAPQENHGRARLRHAEGLDGGDALQDEDPREGPNRDEPAGPRLQSEARHRDPLVGPLMTAMPA
jgi:hypothetical protein